TRLILRKNVQLAKAVEQWGNVGALVAGFYTEDYELIGRSMKDVIIEPSRSILIPGFEEMKEEALKAGALGFSISGAGPSVFALSQSKKVAEEVGKAVGKVLDTFNLDFDVYTSKINTTGSYIVDQ
ncbi:MAG: homoserine kinase, partial [Balneolaceae bacterium]